MRKAGTYRNNRVRWTVADLRFIEQHYATVSPAQIAERLGRSPGAVCLMADKLGCRRRKNPAWTTEEDDVLRTRYAEGVGFATVMALLPGRSEKAIFSRAINIGVTSGIYWREEELRVLDRYYPTEGTAVIKRLAGRTADSVKLKAKRRGLKYQGTDAVFHPWREEEWALLGKTLGLSLAQQAELFPGRTPRAVEKARARLKKRT